MARFLKGFKCLKSGGIPGVFVTKVLEPSDTSQNDVMFDLPKSKEMGGLFDKGTFRVVDRKRASNGSKILDGRSLLAINHM